MLALSARPEPSVEPSVRREEFRMSQSLETLVTESHRQIQQAWAYFARALPAGEVVALDGVLVTDGRSPLAFMNAAFLTTRVGDVADLRARIDRASTHFRAHGVPWVFMPGEDLIEPDLLPALDEAATSAGLQFMMPMTGMVATTLEAPVRPLPALECRLVGDEATRRAVADINGEGYDIPADLMHTATGVRDIWNTMVGVVGYVDGEAVSTASVTPVDDIAYVCLVATRPGAQGKGYAEAVMRGALDAARTKWGVERTVLHATPAGRPVYTRMGYAPTNLFRVYVGH
jgi:GNAT superfamily N-acetyltransferase